MPLYWVRPGDEVVKQQSDAIQVCLRCRLFPLEDLRGYVLRGDTKTLFFRLGTFSAKFHSAAQIHQNNSASFLTHDVLGLYVEVDQSDSMQGRQSPAKVAPDQRGFLRSEWTLLSHELLQRASSNKLHPQSDPSIALLDTVNGNHIRVPQPGEQSTLFEKRRGESVGFGSDRLLLRAEKLQCHLAIQPAIPRPVNLAKASPADPLLDFKMQPPPKFFFGNRRRRVRVRILTDDPSLHAVRSQWEGLGRCLQPLMSLGQIFYDSQVAHHDSMFRINYRPLCLLPIHGLPIRNR